MKRGDVCWINFDASVAGEVKKTRPGVIISNDISNKILNRVQIVPITSRLDKCYPCEAYVIVNGKQGKAMADQIATVSKVRVKNKLGSISKQEIFDLERAIKTQLGM